MGRFPSISQLRTDDSWRYPVVFGLASLPFTLTTYLQSVDNSMSLGPVLLAGLLAAYLSDGQQVPSKRVGLRAGVVGSVATLLPLMDLLSVFLDPSIASPTWFRVVAPVAGALLIVPFVLGFAILSGTIGGMIGGWLAKKTGRRRPPAVGN